MKLWPKPCVRPLRFHDLRHTTASLLIMNGASLVAVQRILRHSDPRPTAKIYVHLLPDYSRDQINLLSFDSPANEVTSRPSSASPAAPCAAAVVQDSSGEPSEPSEGGENPSRIQQVTAVGAAGLEPTTPGFGGRYSIQMSYAPERKRIHSPQPARAQGPRRDAGRRWPRRLHPRERLAKMRRRHRHWQAPPRQV